MLLNHNRIFNRVVFGGIAALAIFYALVQIFPTDRLIVILNGLSLGSMAALIVAFTPLLWYSILGVDPYDRVRQMTIGFALAWFVIGGWTATSFYIRAADLPTTTLISTAFFRYVACIAAALQVMAPDFGLGIFHGRERKTLWTGLAAGTVVAAITIYLQEAQLLEPLVKNAFGRFAALIA